jgi:hypothetical protein
MKKLKFESFPHYDDRDDYSPTRASAPMSPTPGSPRDISPRAPRTASRELANNSLDGSITLKKHDTKEPR